VKEEVKANREAGVDVAVQDAVMDEKGKVDISGPPPDAIQE
jgi:calcium permeable stress-gated cation channel